MEQNGQWLRRVGLDGLVRTMERLSAEYGMPWADSWQRHLDDPGWLRRAIVNTYKRLDETDTAKANPLVQEWLWYAANFDLEAMVSYEYTAEVYLLDRWKRRVFAEGQYRTILVSLRGRTRYQARCRLNAGYEFVRWVP